jgi:hypothetical protein
MEFQRQNIEYLSPGFYHHNYDKKEDDMWTLGIILYKLLSKGKAPFSKE